ncbi:hypothetical protein BgramDRAFT_3467 [Paraburkholderia graminis C4D1M]|jgi:hypothetical protein|uniref:Uncharacterized protein n=1 Tax=Paraburkholderia graminis (strain ATCC 700544 / DSM 17151 / LMG 18924 / NCIMB 13744 / C4D1M) TaxID=396598 RepID=B1G259_PARG4|nr:hypothetical protein BgramDRAFT_3467 [Paraburkholderia graminis C4D1M]
MRRNSHAARRDPCAARCYVGNALTTLLVLVQGDRRQICQSLFSLERV